MEQNRKRSMVFEKMKDAPAQIDDKYKLKSVFIIN